MACNLPTSSEKYEPCHTKTCFTIFVIVIPKERLAGTSPAKPSFSASKALLWYDTDYTCYSIRFVLHFFILWFSW